VCLSVCMCVYSQIYFKKLMLCVAGKSVIYRAGWRPGEELVIQHSLETAGGQAPLSQGPQPLLHGLQLLA
jgi:hypothetical protein